MNQESSSTSNARNQKLIIHQVGRTFAYKENQIHKNRVPSEESSLSSSLFYSDSLEADEVKILEKNQQEVAVDKIELSNAQEGQEQAWEADLHNYLALIYQLVCLLAAVLFFGKPVASYLQRKMTNFISKILGGGAGSSGGGQPTRRRSMINNNKQQQQSRMTSQTGAGSSLSLAPRSSERMTQHAAPSRRASRSSLHSVSALLVGAFSSSSSNTPTSNNNQQQQQDPIQIHGNFLLQHSHLLSLSTHTKFN